MRTILLYGILRQKYGKLHRFEVNTVGEAIRALSVNFPGFEAFLRESGQKGFAFKVVTGNSPLMDEKEVVYPIGKDDCIKLIPVVPGAGDGTFKAIAGVALIAAGIAGSSIGLTPLIFIGSGLLIGGVAQFLSASPFIPPTEQQPDNAKKTTYIFTGPTNNARQGRGIPVGYGRMMVGSITITSGIAYRAAFAGYLSGVSSSITIPRPGGIVSR